MNHTLRSVLIGIAPVTVGLVLAAGITAGIASLDRDTTTPVAHHAVVHHVAGSTNGSTNRP